MVLTVGPYRGPATYVSVAGRPQIVVITNGVKVKYVDQYIEYGLKKFLKNKNEKGYISYTKQVIVDLNIQGVP